LEAEGYSTRPLKQLASHKKSALDVLVVTNGAADEAAVVEVVESLDNL
jgi:hypothetical protein